MTEAAIISPIFFMLLFGVIEMGVLFRDKLTVVNSARDGARTAAAAGNDSDADYRILQTIKQSSSVTAQQNIQRIIIFKATSTASVPDASCLAGTPVNGECNVYTSADMNKAASQFDCTNPALDQPFCPTTSGYRNTTLSTLGYIGVHIQMTHNYVTGFFGKNSDMKERVVFRLEPRTAS